MSAVKEIKPHGQDEADPRASDYKYVDGRYIIPLKYPFYLGDQEIKELKMRKPLTKHIRKLPPEPTNNDMLTIVEVLSDESKGVIDRLDCQDSIAAMEFVGKFL